MARQGAHFQGLTRLCEPRSKSRTVPRYDRQQQLHRQPYHWPVRLGCRLRFLRTFLVHPSGISVYLHTSWREDARDCVPAVPAAVFYLPTLLVLLEIVLNCDGSVDKSKVFFSDLWHLFRPGTEVIGSDAKQAYRVLQVNSPPHRVAPAWQRYGITPTRTRKALLSVICVYIDFDGKSLGPVSRVFDIKPFKGARDVTALEIYPDEPFNHICLTGGSSLFLPAQLDLTPLTDVYSTESPPGGDQGPTHDKDQDATNNIFHRLVLDGHHKHMLGPGLRSSGFCKRARSRSS
ncbi:hypothetical protein ASPCADRAFT_8835 [Aspergillus carbonarius ITEM 5010]|uniref:DUF7025 domain-containing protein n=1 Tax=Aspergillus carbonarius (strain ITEM 5010) TaxID=602072 RepID=A0A1R3RDL0_ASPC5|nr:hypothetical protein ASPCADRAFT_8835 [Aspergillus carbonarius ITEM 5010]